MFDPLGTVHLFRNVSRGGKGLGFAFFKMSMSFLWFCMEGNSRKSKIHQKNANHCFDFVEKSLAFWPKIIILLVRFCMECIAKLVESFIKKVPIIVLISQRKQRYIDQNLSNSLCHCFDFVDKSKASTLKAIWPKIGKSLFWFNARLAKFWPKMCNSLFWFCR